MLLYDSIPGLSEEHMMSRQSKRELHAEVQVKYLKTSRSEKVNILDEFTANTGYYRKYAICILKHSYKHRSSLVKPNTPISPQTGVVGGRSGGSAGANLGNLWTDLLKTTASLSARRDQGIGAVW